MWYLTVSLLIATGALAQYHEGQRQSSYPMDFSDDIYNRVMRGFIPDRLAFNFEQRRIDQPPQVEMRDENMRQYIGRPKTTTPVPVPTRITEMPVQVPVNTNRLHDVAEARLSVPTDLPKFYDPKQWGPMASHLPASLPPPPDMPNWMDLSHNSFKHGAHQMPNRNRADDYVPTPAADSTQKPTEQPITTEEFVRPSGRGSHKFNWADVSVTEPVISTTTVAAVPTKIRNPPPSFPTLSPWYDGFGK